MRSNRFSARGVSALDVAAAAQVRHGTLTARLTDANVDDLGNSFHILGAAVLRSAAGVGFPVLTVPRRVRALSVTLDLPLGDTFRRQPGTGRGLVETRSTSDEKAILPLGDVTPTEPFRIRNGSTACTFERAKPCRRSRAAHAFHAVDQEGRR